ncbi:hypothetical protein RCO48_08495 [Peribacillus frigoritolerans]|nr:hypothetical protein [Peribacillus frigoritolerans]
MLRYEASTGGTDLLAQFISKAFFRKYRGSYFS